MRPLLVALVLVAGCSSRHLSQPFAAPQYPDGPDGLKQLWGDILDAARKDERERVHDLLATTILSDEQMRRLFGAAIEPQLPRYHQLVGTLVNRGALELVAQVAEKKYDTIDVFDDDHDAAVRAALREPHAVWSARVRKATDTRGLRYDCFVYLDGGWRTGNQLGKFLTAAGDGGAAAADGGAAAAAKAANAPSPTASGAPAAKTNQDPKTTSAAKTEAGEQTAPSAKATSAAKTQP